MKILFIIVLLFICTTQSLSQKLCYSNLDNVVSHLANELSTKVDNATTSRIVLGKITLKGDVSPEIGEEFHKAILKSNEIQNSFTVISNQYTRYISRKTSDTEILTIAENVKAEYILIGVIKRVDLETMEIFLSLIDMVTKGEIGVSALYINKSEDLNLEKTMNVDKNNLNRTEINGLIGSYNFIEPQNENFANKLGKQVSFDAGLIFTLYSAPTDFLGTSTLLELQFSYIHGDFINNISFYNLKAESESIFVEKEQINDFNVYAGLMGIDLSPKLTESLYLIGGVSLTYGAVVLNSNKLDQNFDIHQNQKYDQNPSNEKRILSLYSLGYSGGILLKLSLNSPLILFVRYYSSFYSKDTEWHGVKAGIILSFHNNQKGFER